MAVDPKPRLRQTVASLDHQKFFDAFVCNESRAREVTRFLRNKALKEQDQGMSKTTVFLADPTERCDAFVTLSAASLEMPREELTALRKFVPGVMVDWLGVHIEHNGKGLGHDIFKWVEREALALRRTSPVGLRLIVLAVRAANWTLFQRYAAVWGFTPLPLPTDPDNDESPHERPDPKNERPEWLAESRFIHMYYDLLSRKNAEPQ